MILYEFVQKPTNLYVTICIQFVQYELCCTNCVLRIRIIKKQNKSSHMIPTHALLITKPNCYQLAVLLTELLTYFIIYYHTEILYKKTIRKMRLYKFIQVAYSSPIKHKSLGWDYIRQLFGKWIAWIFFVGRFFFLILVSLFSGLFERLPKQNHRPAGQPDSR